MHKYSSDTRHIRKTNVVNRIVEELSEQSPLDAKLNSICNIIPEAFTNPEDVCVRITFDNESFQSYNFKSSKRTEKYSFSTPDLVQGLIELHFSGNYIKKGNPEIICDEFLSNVASLLAWNISSVKLGRLVYDNTERLKELKGIRRTAEVLSKSNSIDE